MKPLPHHYHVRLAGGPAGHARLSMTGAPDLTSAPPLDFDGPGDAWSPEHLLLAAVESCFLFTLRAVARGSKFEFTSLEVSSEGTVDRVDGVTRFTEIVLRPRLIVPPGADATRALGLMERCEKAVPGGRFPLDAGPARARSVGDQRVNHTRPTVVRLTRRRVRSSPAGPTGSGQRAGSTRPS